MSTASKMSAFRFLVPSTWPTCRTLINTFIHSPVCSLHVTPFNPVCYHFQHVGSRRLNASSQCVMLGHYLVLLGGRDGRASGGRGASRGASWRAGAWRRSKTSQKQSKTAVVTAESTHSPTSSSEEEDSQGHLNFPFQTLHTIQYHSNNINTNVNNTYKSSGGGRNQSEERKQTINKP